MQITFVEEFVVTRANLSANTFDTNVTWYPTENDIIVVIIQVIISPTRRWKECDDMCVVLDTILECDRQTDLLSLTQYHALHAEHADA